MPPHTLSPRGSSWPARPARGGLARRLASLAVVAALAHAAASGGAARHTPPRGQTGRSLAGYIVVVRHARDLVRMGTGREVVSAADLLRATGTVETGPGRAVSPDNSAILADLAARPARLAAAEARLTALLADLETVSRASSAADGRGALDAVFTRPPFTDGRQPSLFESLWQRLSGWLGSVIRRVFPGQLASGRLVPTVLLTAASLVAAMVVVGGGRGLFRMLAPRTVAQPDAPSPDEGLDALGARQLASRAAGREDYRDALRYAFLAILLDLDARDLIRFSPTTADRALIGQARRHDPGLGDLLARATRDFQTVWYGHRPCGQADYVAMAGLAERIGQTAGERRGGGE